MSRYIKELSDIMKQLENLEKLQKWLLQSAAMVEEFNSIDPGESEQVWKLSMIIILLQSRNIRQIGDNKSELSPLDR